MMTDDFLLHLYKGEEALRDGSLDDAREHLEKAFRIKPDHEKNLSLLGLAYYRLANYYRASQVYRRLVNLIPDDPVLRLNHALTLMRLDKLEDAERELNSCLALSPENSRAKSLLGILCSRKGEYDDALEYFRSAGQYDMVAEIEERQRKKARGESGLVRELDVDDVEEYSEPVVGFTRGDGESWGWRAEDRKAAGLPDSGDTQEPPVGDPELAPVVEILPAEPVEGTPGAAVVGTGAAEAEDPGFELKGVSEENGIELEPVIAEEQEQFDAAGDDLEGEPASEGPTLRPALIPVPMDSKPRKLGPFQVVDPCSMVVDVQTAAYVRWSRITAVWGKIDAAAERTRRMGTITDSALGGMEPLARMTGKGGVLVSARAGGIVLCEAAGETLYFREDMVLGFDSDLTFESGKLAGKGIAPDIELLTFSGTGATALERSGLAWLDLDGEEPVYVRWDRLAGWTGNLMPKVVTLSITKDNAVPAVKLTGAGRALVCIDPL